MGIQDFFKSAGNGACLALCYIRAALGKEATPQMMIDALYKAAERNIVNVKKDCFVEDAIALMKVANPTKVYSVIKKDVSSILSFINILKLLSSFSVFIRCSNFSFLNVLIVVTPNIVSENKLTAGEREIPSKRFKSLAAFKKYLAIMYPITIKIGATYNEYGL